MTDPSDFWHILPNYVKKDVVHYLDFKTRCNLSYCSKSDLALVKSTPIAFRYIDWYSARVNEWKHICFNTLNCPKDRPTKLGIACVERLCDMLRAPNTCKYLRIDGFLSDANQEMIIQVTRELKVQNIHPKIQSLEWTYSIEDNFYEFLTQIDADYLNGISVNSLDGTKEQFARIFQTEQWRKLKAVIIQWTENWLEYILDKPIFHISVQDTSLETARRIVKTFQEKNHPVDSSFNVLFYNCINVREVYEDSGRRIENFSTVR